MTNKTILVLTLLTLILFITGCATQSIKDIKDADHVGTKVTVKGTVQNTIKIGSLSGYQLKDSNGDSIGVSSEKLPKEGDETIVRGILMKDTILGYYIKES
jgi:hypothetical protein